MWSLNHHSICRQFLVLTVQCQRQGDKVWLGWKVLTQNSYKFIERQGVSQCGISLYYHFLLFIVLIFEYFEFRSEPCTSFALDVLRPPAIRSISEASWEEFGLLGVRVLIRFGGLQWLIEMGDNMCFMEVSGRKSNLIRRLVMTRLCGTLKYEHIQISNTKPRFVEDICHLVEGRNDGKCAVNILELSLKHTGTSSGRCFIYLYSWS